MDTKKQKTGEKRLEQFALILEKAPYASIMVNKEGKIVLANPQTSKLFGYSTEEIVGKPIEILVPHRFRAQHVGWRNNFCAHPQPRQLGDGRDLSGVKKDGTEVPVEIGLNPIKTAKGLFIAATIIDITERKQAEEIIAAKTKELETLIFITSHDLREPLRAIDGFSQIIRKNYAKNLGKGKEFFERMEKAVKRMNRLLDDILLLSLTQKAGIATERIEGESVVNEALGRLEEVIALKKAKIRVLNPLPKIKAHRAWTTQAIYNLLTNALKFTKEGERPDIEIASAPGGGIVVRDRGTGIPQKDRKRIFEMFQRAVGREIEGTGSGLTIARTIAERHGGKVWMKPRKGGGSEFTITFG